MYYKLPRTRYVRPRSLGEALEILAENPEAAPLAGGTDLLVDMKLGRRRPGILVDIRMLDELRGITVDNNHVVIGAATTLEEILGSPVVAEKLPLLREAVYNMASWQIRNIATIGGNLCNASPAADTAPPLLVYGAQLIARSRRGERTIAIEDFFHGPRKTALERDEILAAIRVPIPPENHGAAFIKLGRRNSFTLSIVGVAAALTLGDDGRVSWIRIALNSVAPTPVRARSVEAALYGKTLSMEAVEKAADKVIGDISPISDVRASKKYREEMARVLVREAVLKAADRLRGKHRPVG